MIWLILTYCVGMWISAGYAMWTLKTDLDTDLWYIHPDYRALTSAAIGLVIVVFSPIWIPIAAILDIIHPDSKDKS